MKSPAPKVLFDVCGRPSLVHVVALAQSIGAGEVRVVVSREGQDACRSALAEAGLDAARLVIQDPPLGTGHAVREALADVGDANGDVLVLYGDGPCLKRDSLEHLLEQHRAPANAATLLTANLAEPKGYGRVVTGRDGAVERIVEELDADAQTRSIREVNTGVLVFDLAPGRRAVQAIGRNNAKGEYYLTDMVELLRKAGHRVGRVQLDDPEEARSFNSHAELAAVRRLLRERIIRRHQDNGVDIVDPATTYIDADVEIGPGTRILPCTVIGAGVRIGCDCVIGPFTHLRIMTVLEDGAEIGNFTEVKKSIIGAGARAKHLTYLGDASVGAQSNIGCGTITANFDGKTKHATTIGAGAFIGSGTVLIAPCEVSAGGTTGAGAVVLRDCRIGPGEIYVGVPARPLRKRADAPAGAPPAPGGEERS